MNPSTVEGEGISVHARGLEKDRGRQTSSHGTLLPLRAAMVAAAVGVLLILGTGGAQRAQAQVELVLHSFTGASGDGADPVAGLVMDPNTGDLYGTTRDGGSSSVGTVFKLTASSGYTSEIVLHSFAGKLAGDGANPEAGLVMDPNTGNLYGTTRVGGSSGPGTVFVVATKPKYETGLIVDDVNALYTEGVLNKGQDGSLLKELDDAISGINAGKANKAMGNLESFITEVNDLYNSGILNETEGTELVNDATTVIGQLQAM
jgi:uncharacterized repeat protein (TIGR03803 family)